jgi:lactate permease
MPLIVSILPIILLVFLMTKKRSVPSKVALPSVALLTYFFSLIFLRQDPLQVNAAVIDGALTALTPVTIITGAIFLFKAMEKTGALEVIRGWLNGVSSNKAAQLMIIGWAFGFLIEGASGFGTPAALAAPILVGLGFNPLNAALFTLIMNSVPVSFGAVGTPTWFGFSGIAGLSSADILEIGLKTAVIHGIAAFIIPVIGLLFVLDFKQVRKNLGFIYISVAACVVPYVAAAFVNYEFPSLFGGFIGFFISIVAAKRGWGLEKTAAADTSGPRRYSFKVLVKALFPLWGTLLLLIATRVPALGLKRLMTLTDPEWTIRMGTLGTFSVSPALVLKLKNILGTPAAWDYSTLYVPGIIPFILIAVITFFLFRTNRAGIRETMKETAERMEGPFKALLGALVFVNLIMLGGDRSPAMIIGSALAQGLGWGWEFFAPYLGALGSFFAGSNTVSNLTFGPIQDSIALSLGLNRTTVLAAQSVGGAMGNMVCINNIVAVCSVLGLTKAEGKILKKTVLPMLAYGIIAGAVSLLIF